MANIQIPFTTPGNYTYDDTKIEVADGLAKLISLYNFSDAVAQWKLNDDAANTIVLDAIETYNGVASTNTENLSVAGKINKAFDFNSGNLEYVTVSSTTVAGINDFTILGWFKTPNEGVAKCIYSETYTPTSSTPLILIELSAGGLFSCYYRGNYTPIAILQTVGEYDNNTYHSFMYKRSGNDFTLSLDGGSEVITTTVAVTAARFTNSVQIGRWGNTSPVDYFNGEIDNLIILQSAISDADYLKWHNEESEGLEGYASSSPTIYKSSGNDVTNIVTYNNFVVTVGGGSEGNLGYQLSNDGITWYYWNGAEWAETSILYNTEATVNTNISSFSTTNEKIYVKSFLISDGDEKVEIDSIDISYDDNTIPLVDAGTNKTAIKNETVSFLSNCSFSDPDGNIVKAEYKIVGEIDDWTEILQGDYGSLLEAVQVFTYTFNNLGSIVCQLRVTDNGDLTAEDSLTVVVSKTTATITILDGNTGLEMDDVLFTAGDGTEAFDVDSPFDYDYGLGVFSTICTKDDYNALLTDITVDVDNPTFTLTMVPTSPPTEVTEEINIDVDASEIKINIEVE